MKKIVNINISKIYMMLVVLITSIIVLSYSSYAIFSVRNEKHNAIHVTTGNLSYRLEGSQITQQQIEIEAAKSEFISVTITSLNTIDSYYQMYYNNDSVYIYYQQKDDLPFGQIGTINNNSQKTINLVIINNSSTKQKVTLGVKGGFIGHTLTLENGQNKICDSASLMKSYYDVASYSNTQGPYYVKEVDYHAKEYREKITSVITKNNIMIPDNIIDHWDVSEANDNSVVAYLESDGAGGYRLTIGGRTKIFLPENARYLFLRFSAIQTMDLQYFNTMQAKNMHRLFQYCTDLATLDVSMFDTSKVEDMSTMFADCTKLTNISFQNFNTSSAKTLYAMFARCESLTKLDLTSFNTQQTTTMGMMFQSCTNLKELNISSFDTSNVTVFEKMFDSCSNLTTLDIRNFNTKKATNMIHMFRDASTLQKIMVGSNWTIQNATTTSMFLGCGTDKVTIV